MADTVSNAWVAGARRGWSALTLGRQFLLAGGAVLVAGMLVIGLWVTQQIEEGVTRNAAATTALYVDSVMAPLLPDLRRDEALSEGARRALDETLSQGSLGDRLTTFKIWREGGLIAYSNQRELIGRRFEPTESLKLAWSGQVAAEFDELNDAEDALERAAGVPLLEIYSPIREPWSGEVVAVAEFYEQAEELSRDLRAVRLKSWLLVATVTLCMMGLLSGIVMRGSGVITAQRGALESRIEDLSELLRQNTELRRRVQRASSRAVASNERNLKRISADLHDGPAQLLALASLRLSDAGPGGDLATIRAHLDSAMQDIRDICRGLTLPQIENAGLGELISAAAVAHERRTGTVVGVVVPDASPPLTQAEKICVFRFIQEGLNNAFRHAGGVGQTVGVTLSEDTLSVTVADAGGGFEAAAAAREGLGLAGLRERVESLGGVLEIDSSTAGTLLSMRLNLADQEKG